MTKIKLKKPIDLGIGPTARHLNPGENVLTDQERGLWFIDGLIAQGIIEIVEDKGVEIPQQKVLNYANNNKPVFFSESAPKPVETAKEEKKGPAAASPSASAAAPAGRKPRV